MKIVSWRNATLVLLALCAFQRYQACTRKPPAKLTHELRVLDQDGPVRVGAASDDGKARTSVAPAPSLPAATADKTGGKTFFGVKIPAWVMRFAPQPGENLRDYRDRMLPLAQMAIAPQRARVARLRDQLPSLDARQRAELDAAVAEAATAIQDRVMNGILSGELNPATMRPMTGVTMARELLSIVEKGHNRFDASLSAQQRSEAAKTRFDFADYLLFSARWEDALKILD